MSSFGCLERASTHFEWDDYLGHHRITLSAEAIALIAQFHDWVYPADIWPDSPEMMLQIETLIAAGVLVEEHSAREADETRLTSSWTGWSSSARHFHYGTRTDERSRFTSPSLHTTDLLDGLADSPPPPAFREPHGSVCSLKRVDLETLFAGRPLASTLDARRSCRKFDNASIDSDILSGLLDAVAGVTTFAERTQTVFKRSPSGGGRHPTEIYIAAKRVNGIGQGIYRYLPKQHALEWLNTIPSDDMLLRACAQQEWMIEASVLFFYTSCFSRNKWKYATARSYRTLLLDVGHLNQTLLLSATAVGLGTVFTAALRDALIEEALGCDPASELLMGCTAAGYPAVHG